MMAPAFVEAAGQLEPQFWLVKLNSDSTPADTSSRSQALPVEVLVLELVGPDAFLHFDLATPEVTGKSLKILDDSADTGASASRFTARVSSDNLDLDVTDLDLFIDLPRLHFFDRETTTMRALGLIEK